MTELIENESARKAQQLLRFYFRRLFTAAKAEWDADAAGDIESIVPFLLEALDERVQLAVGKALLSQEMQDSTPERVLIGARNIRLGSIERIARMPGGYRIIFESGGVMDLTPAEGRPLWELLEAQAINLDERTKDQ